MAAAPSPPVLGAILPLQAAHCKGFQANFVTDWTTTGGEVEEGQAQAGWISNDDRFAGAFCEIGYVVGMERTGIEPVTSGLQSRRSPS